MLTRTRIKQYLYDENKIIRDFFSFFAVYISMYTILQTQIYKKLFEKKLSLFLSQHRL